MKLTLTRLQIHEGERVPRWYGIAYHEWGMDIAVCLPIPLNLVVRAARSVWIWAMATMRPAWWERKLRDAYQRGFEVGYRGGIRDGRSQLLADYLENR